MSTSGLDLEAITSLEKNEILDFISITFPFLPTFTFLAADLQFFLYNFLIGDQDVLVCLNAFFHKIRQNLFTSLFDSPYIIFYFYGENLLSDQLFHGSVSAHKIISCRFEKLFQ